MRAGTLAFALGICLSLWIPRVPAAPVLTASVLFCLPLLLAFRRLPLAAAYLAGLLWGTWHLSLMHTALLPVELVQQDIWLRGEVRGLPRDSLRSRRVDFHSRGWCDAETPAVCDAQQRWQRQHWKVQLSDYQHLALSPGQQAELRVRLKRPRGFANPGTFDYEAWLWTQGYQATGYVRDHDDNRIRSGNEPGLPARIDALRLSLRERLLALTGGGQEAQGEERQGGAGIRFHHAPILLALGIGDQGGLSERDWQLFSATGTNHLMVISGLHIGLVATLGYHLALLLWRLLPALPARVPAPTVAALGAIVFAGAYCLLAGFSLPTRRAFIMVAAFMSSRLLYCQGRATNGLGLALLIILILNPLAPLSAGFWLSFGAVALLLYATTADFDRAQHPLKRYWRSALESQWVLSVGLLPLLLLHFQQMSLLAPLVNLLAIPLVGLLVVPLTLTGMLLLPIAAISRWILLAADRLLHLLMTGMESSLEAFPGMLLRIGWPRGFWALLTLLCLGLLLLKRRRLAKLASLALLPFLLLRTPPGPPHGSLVLHVLDVGQGEALVLEDAESVTLYDTGPAYSERFDAGSGLLAPFLRHHGLKPDLIIVSHGDSDHAGGLPGLRESWPEVPVMGGEPQRLEAPVEACRQGQAWYSGGLEYQVLSPRERFPKGNDNSCVLAVSGPWGRLLITGDIEGAAERRLLANSRDALQADIMTVPHHGSRSSSTPGLLNTVAPRLALISSGHLNRFGHPHEEILARYRVRDIRTLGTAENGYLRITLRPDRELVVHRYRSDRPRVWR